MGDFIEKMATRIILQHVRHNPQENINRELQWLGSSLGLFNLRDKDSSCFRVFITLVKKSKRDETLSSDDIAEQLHLSRGTVVHHLTKLMNSGIVVREKEGYLLRENTLRQVIQDMRQEMERMFAEMETVAKEIDERMG